jgi:hypothetical protein
LPETTVPGPVPATATQAAIHRAAVALHDLECPDRSCEPQVFAHCFRQARVALEAAWPLLAERPTAQQREAAWEAWHRAALAPWTSSDCDDASHEAFCAGWEHAKAAERAAWTSPASYLFGLVDGMHKVWGASGDDWTRLVESFDALSKEVAMLLDGQDPVAAHNHRREP